MGRPKKLDGKTYKIETGCGKLLITVNHKDGKPIEILSVPDKYGICRAHEEGLARTISLALRRGVELSEVIEELSGIVCNRCMAWKKEKDKEDRAKLPNSCPDAIARVLKGDEDE